LQNLAAGAGHGLRCGSHLANQNWLSCFLY
jgi:hypothetical protein